MSFLKQVIEDASAGAISTGDISGTRSCLFSKPIARVMNKKTKAGFTILKFNAKTPTRKTESVLNKAIAMLIAEEEFNSLDVISKLQYAEKNVDRDKTSTIFGLESDDGVVKVYIPHEEAAAFESELQKELKSDIKREIGEILFELRNKFNIIHVDWPPIPEDEEVDMQMQDTQPPADGTPLADGTPPADAKGDIDGGDMPDEKEATDIEPPAGEDTSSIKSMLDKVIDMLKTDAEARTAESNAKAKEAEAKEAEAAVKIADIKVRAEEEVLDAEQYYKKQNDNRKEAQKLTKLATFRQAMSQQRASDNMHNGKFE